MLQNRDIPSNVAISYSIVSNTVLEYDTVVFYNRLDYYPMRKSGQNVFSISNAAGCPSFITEQP